MLEGCSNQLRLSSLSNQSINQLGIVRQCVFPYKLSSFDEEILFTLKLST